MPCAPARSLQRACMDARIPARRLRGAPSILLVALLALAPPPARAGEAKGAFKDGTSAMSRGDWDWAVIYLQKATDLRPDNPEYRKQLSRAKQQASFEHFEVAKRHLAAGNLEPAITELQQVVNLNPTHQYAYVELERALGAWKKANEERDAEASALEEAKRQAGEAVTAVPKLDPTSNIPIQFQIENKPIKDIFKIISEVSNINVIFDDGVPTDKAVSLVTDNVTLEEALDLFMLQNALTYKVYNDHTILVYQDNQTKQREYEDQFIRTFYLSNADVKEVNALLRSVIDLRKTSTNEQLNAITIRDSQDKIAIAGKLIEANDKAKAELVIDLEILEVNRKKLKKYGIDIRTGSEAGLNSTIAFDDTQVRLNNMRRFTQLGSYVMSPIPSAIVSLLRSDSDTRTLSRPQVRVTDGERVTVHLGDQVPIPNTTFNSSNTVGGNIVPITSFTYQNTGIQINLEPRIHHNREVTLKIQAEISAVGSTTAGGQPTIGTREVDTVIRLRDGETNLLAGLFAELLQNSNSGLPLLSSLPGLRHLFGANSKSTTESEIVLTVTPHIVRIPDISLADLVPLQVGTERNTRLKGSSHYGVGGSPFRKPGEKPQEDFFSVLRPGEQSQDRETLIVPDFGLAAGTESPEMRRAPIVVGNDLAEALLAGEGPAAPTNASGASPATSGSTGGGSTGGGSTGGGSTGGGSTGGGATGGGSTGGGSTGGGSTGGGATGGGATGGGSTGGGATGGGSTGGGATGGGSTGGGSTGGGATGGGSTGGGGRTPGQPTGPARLSIQAPAELRVGERIVAEIRIDAAGNEVSHAPYHVVFDPAVLRVVSAVEGDFFRAAGASSTFIPNIQPGRLIVGHSQFQGSQSVSGAGSLAVLTLEALAPGETTLRFDRIALADRTNDPVASQASNALVRVSR